MINKPRRITVSKAKKRAWTAFSLYIRTRDCIESTGCPDWGFCFTCGKRYHIKLLQAGHFVAGRHNAGLLDEVGVYGQCYNCNINLKGNTLEYRRRLIAKYGEGIDIQIENRAKESRKYTAEEWLEFETLYKNKLKKLLKGYHHESISPYKSIIE